MTQPTISVVIASVNGLPYLAQCLTALESQRGNLETETIVVDCTGTDTGEYVRSAFPWVRLLEIPRRLGIPELRAIGMRESKGRIIAVTEDHCIPRTDWLLEINRAHESSFEVVGGAVENGSVNRIVDWAVFLCEYSQAMPPIPSGVSAGVAGNNVSYKREALERVDESIKSNYWEYFIHEDLRRAGVRFLSVPSIVVSHKKECGVLYFLAQRFHYSRSFAGMRRTRWSLLRRAAFVLLSPLVPWVLLVRIFKQALLKKRYWREFLQSLPLLVIFLISYACGECVGCLKGPGNSLIKIQ